MNGIIGIDWGTTSFRAYHIDQNSKILKTVESDAGILSCKDEKFENVLRKQLEPFGKIVHSLPIFASGMITSRQGWFETDYVECPAGIQELIDGIRILETEHFGNIHFMPGVKQLQPEPDIMRGEETQLIGLDLIGNHTCLLPGTHSKWVQMKNDAIKTFTTYMTGDLFSALLQKSVLQATPEGKWSDNSFQTGVQHGFLQSKQGNSLLSLLFQVRVTDILNQKPELDTRSFLSGLLIGCEIAAGSSMLSQESSPLMVAGSDHLSRLYLLALATCGTEGIKGPDTASARGLFRIAKYKEML